MIYDPRRDGVSQGLLTQFMRCKEEVRLAISGLVPLRTSQALQFGTLVHLVLEDIYGSLKRLPTESEVLKSIAKATKAYKEEQGGRLSIEEIQFQEINLVLLEVVLPEYFKFWKSDFSKIKWLELEQKFSVPSPVAGLNLIGRIDGAFWTKTGKELWSFESKTKGRIEEDEISATLPLDFQNGVYTRALRIKHKVRPRGTLQNIIRRPGQKLKAGESLPEFRKRVKAEVLGNPRYYFLRMEVAVPQSDADDFEKELKIVCAEFLDWCDNRTNHRKNRTACIQRYGPCKFLPICGENQFSLFRRRDAMFPELARP